MDEHKVTPAPLPLSFTQMRIVTQDELTGRFEAVKELAVEANQLYRVVKDTETGEHYLHYAVFHIHIAGGGAEEEYHHLLPLEHDDVIALALGAPLFEYPQQWLQPYLRNGPNEAFVWYDPSGVTEQDQSYADTEAYMKERLLAFREQADQSEEAVRKLLDEIDKQLPPILE